MTLGSMLETLILGPLKFIFEIIFQIVYELVQDPGICIIALSIVMNILVLPLYRRADAVQEQARDKEASLAPGISHIRKTFSGNERMMMLQTYYRQNDYSPLHAFRGSVSLLLEIPFFMAAYQFLSNLKLLSGTSFGPIPDLGAPDKMLTIGALAINLLPILMTLINFASAAVYLKGFPLKMKIRTYAIAVVFLVLLYNSPAGLVFYWTLNNVFSLVKNIVLKVVAPKRKAKRAEGIHEPDGKLFILSAAYLTVLVGAFIPSVFISASPQEYVDPANFFNPLWYIVSTLLLAAGFFLLWFGVFYRLASPKGKVFFERGLAVFAVVGTVNYMFFGTKLGVISASLLYEGGLSFSVWERILNILVFAGVTTAVLISIRKMKTAPKYALAIGMAALLLMAAMNTGTTVEALKGLKDREPPARAEITLNRTGKNVVVLFLDRAMGEYIPYIMKEKPELREMFDGFTWYENTISFGGYTNMGAPPLMGGYEYTPVEMNRRDTEKMKDKHNEAVKMLPVLFLENGFEVTVCDAPYANYKWIPDLSIFDEHPEIHRYITKGMFGGEESKEERIRNNLRNFFAFSFMKTLPLELQPALYDGGGYLIAGGRYANGNQILLSRSKSRATGNSFMEPFEVLSNLSSITTIKEQGKDQYLFFYNDSPHDPILLKEPDYKPEFSVDNTEYDAAHEDRFTVGEKHLIVEDGTQMSHYHANMAAFLKLGDWLQYLRGSGVYDNTRIILVSDHGRDLGQDPDRLFKRGPKSVDTESFYPLLMVKDFNASGFTVSEEFMTHADTPAIAVQGLIDDPVNPFTGKKISMEEKTAHDQFIMTSDKWRVKPDRNTFEPSGWAVVGRDSLDRENWAFIDEEIVLKEHRIP